MKFICSRDRLMEAISIVQKSVGVRSPLPILDGILVEAGQGVKLTGYDMETSIECLVEADVPVKGGIVINARIFGDIIRKLPDDVVRSKPMKTCRSRLRVPAPISRSRACAQKIIRKFQKCPTTSSSMFARVS